jgi:hypothetical protein
VTGQKVQRWTCQKSRPESKFQNGVFSRRVQLTNWSVNIKPVNLLAGTVRAVDTCQVIFGRGHAPVTSSRLTISAINESEKKDHMTTLTLTNNHLCSHTDGGKSTYVFHTIPIVVLPERVQLDLEAKPLERGTDQVELDGK